MLRNLFAILCCTFCIGAPLDAFNDQVFLRKFQTHQKVSGLAFDDAVDKKPRQAGSKPTPTQQATTEAPTIKTNRETHQQEVALKKMNTVSKLVNAQLARQKLVQKLAEYIQTVVPNCPRNIPVSFCKKAPLTFYLWMKDLRDGEQRKELRHETDRIIRQFILFAHANESPKTKNEFSE